MLYILSECFLREYDDIKNNNSLALKYVAGHIALG